MSQDKATRLRNAKLSIDYTIETLEMLQCYNSNKKVIVNLLKHCSDKLQRLESLCKGEIKCPEYISTKTQKE